VEPGLYVTFFTQGTSFENDLPPVGPLEHLVILDRRIVADRKSVHHTDGLGGGNRWIQAELELQRAMGNEPGGARHPDIRVGAPGGVYLRFASFGDAPEPNAVPELGPFAIVVLGRNGLEADGELIATRTGTKRTLWELTRAAGKKLEGVVRPDIAFRSSTTVYHPKVRAAQPRPAIVSRIARPPASPPAVAPAPHESKSPAAAQIPAPTVARPVERGPAPPTGIDEPTGTLLNRITATPRVEERRSVQRNEDSSWREILWRARLVITTALVVAVVVFGFTSLRTSLTTPSTNVVGIGKVISGPRWDYQVDSVSRAPTAGRARPQGVYLVVRVAATNRGSAGARIVPRDFVVVDASGGEHTALPETDPAYFSDQNTNSPYVWTNSYPVGRTAPLTLIFDVSPSLKGLQLVAAEVPGTRVRLD